MYGREKPKGEGRRGRAEVERPKGKGRRGKAEGERPKGKGRRVGCIVLCLTILERYKKCDIAQHCTDYTE